MILKKFSKLDDVKEMIEMMIESVLENIGENFSVYLANSLLIFFSNPEFCELFTDKQMESLFSKIIDTKSEMKYNQFEILLILLKNENLTTKLTKYGENLISDCSDLLNQSNDLNLLNLLANIYRILEYSKQFDEKNLNFLIEFIWKILFHEKEEASFEILQISCRILLIISTKNDRKSLISFLAKMLQKKREKYEKYEIEGSSFHLPTDSVRVLYSTIIDKVEDCSEEDFSCDLFDRFYLEETQQNSFYDLSLQSPQTKKSTIHLYICILNHFKNGHSHLSNILSSFVENIFPNFISICWKFVEIEKNLEFQVLSLVSSYISFVKIFLLDSRDFGDEEKKILCVETLLQKMCFDKNYFSSRGRFQNLKLFLESFSTFHILTNCKISNMILDGFLEWNTRPISSKIFQIFLENHFKNQKKLSDIYNFELKKTLIFPLFSKFLSSDTKKEDVTSYSLALPIYLNFEINQNASFQSKVLSMKIIFSHLKDLFASEVNNNETKQRWNVLNNLIFTHIISLKILTFEQLFKVEVLLDHNKVCKVYNFLLFMSSNIDESVQLSLIDFLSSFSSKKQIQILEELTLNVLENNLKNQNSAVQNKLTNFLKKVINTIDPNENSFFYKICDFLIEKSNFFPLSVLSRINSHFLINNSLLESNKKQQILEYFHSKNCHHTLFLSLWSESRYLRNSSKNILQLLIETKKISLVHISKNKNLIQDSLDSLSKSNSTLSHVFILFLFFLFILCFFKASLLVLQLCTFSEESLKIHNSSGVEEIFSTLITRIEKIAVNCEKDIICFSSSSETFQSIIETLEYFFSNFKKINLKSQSLLQICFKIIEISKKIVSTSAIKCGENNFTIIPFPEKCTLIVSERIKETKKIEKTSRVMTKNSWKTCANICSFIASIFQFKKIDLKVSLFSLKKVLDLLFSSTHPGKIMVFFIFYIYNFKIGIQEKCCLAIEKISKNIGEEETTKKIEEIFQEMKNNNTEEVRTRNDDTIYSLSILSLSKPLKQETKKNIISNLLEKMLKILEESKENVVIKRTIFSLHFFLKKIQNIFDTKKIESLFLHCISYSASFDLGIKYISGTCLATLKNILLLKNFSNFKDIYPNISKYFLENTQNIQQRFIFFVILLYLSSMKAEYGTEKEEKNLEMIENILKCGISNSDNKIRKKSAKSISKLIFTEEYMMEIIFSFSLLVKQKSVSFNELHGKLLLIFRFYKVSKSPKIASCVKSWLVSDLFDDLLERTNYLYFIVDSSFQIFKLFEYEINETKKLNLLSLKVIENSNKNQKISSLFYEMNYQQVISTFFQQNKKISFENFIQIYQNNENNEKIRKELIKNYNNIISEDKEIAFSDNWKEITVYFSRLFINEKNTSILPELVNILCDLGVPSSINNCADCFTKALSILKSGKKNITNYPKFFEYCSKFVSYFVENREDLVEEWMKILNTLSKQDYEMKVSILKSIFEKSGIFIFLKSKFNSLLFNRILIILIFRFLNDEDEKIRFFTCKYISSLHSSDFDVLNISVSIDYLISIIDKNDKYLQQFISQNLFDKISWRLFLNSFDYHNWVKKKKILLFFPSDFFLKRFHQKPNILITMTGNPI